MNHRVTVSPWFKLLWITVSLCHRGSNFFVYLFEKIINKKKDQVSKKLRSQDWFGKSDKMGFVHRSWLRNQGYPDDYFRGKPVIGICNTWSELTPCNGHLRDFAEIVKRGVELGAPLHLTWSCYQADERACGRCDSCALRLRAFAEAGVRDPIQYA